MIFFSIGKLNKSKRRSEDMIRMCQECLYIGEHHPNCPNAEDEIPPAPAMTETEATYIVCDTLNIMLDDWVETDSQFYIDAVYAIRTLKTARGWRL